MKKVVQFLPILILIISVSCNKPSHYGGNPTTSERDLDTNYTGITIEGAFDLHIVQDQDYDIKIECSQNLLPYISTTTSNGELFITEENNRIRDNSPRRIYVNKSYLLRIRNDGSGNVIGSLAPATKLNLENRGSGNMTINSTTEEHVFVFNDGSGDFQLSGNTKNLIIEIRGSGNVEAFDLQAINGNIEIDGSGDVMVNVEESLIVSINGSGDVVYMGNPSLQVNIQGSGNVHPY